MTGYHWNPATGRLEDEQGNPAPAEGVPLGNVVSRASLPGGAQMPPPPVVDPMVARGFSPAPTPEPEPEPSPAMPEPMPVAQAPGPPGITAPPPGLQALGKTVTSKTDEVTRKVESDRTKSGYQALDEAGQQQDRAATQQTDAHLKLLNAESLRADMKANTADYYRLERGLAKEEAARTIAARLSAEDKANAQVEQDAKITTLWEDKGAAANVIQAFLKGLSQYAHIKAGGQGMSPAYQAFQDVEAKDRQVKLDKFTASKEFRLIARQNTADARTAYAEKLHELNNEELVKLNVIDRQADSLAAKLKTPEALAQAEALKAQTAARRAEVQVARGAHLDATVQSGGTVTHQQFGLPAEAKALEKPLSAEAKDLAVKSDQYAKLAAKNAAILRKNNGFPVGGKEATEFINNDKAMARLIQVGASDNDEKAAMSMQDAPGLPTRLMGAKGTVENYVKNLEVNSARLADGVTSRLQLEGRGGGAAPEVRMTVPQKVERLRKALVDPGTPKADKVRIQRALAEMESRRKAEAGAR